MPTQRRMVFFSRRQRVLAATLLMAATSWAMAHGIKPKEKQFPAGVPETVQTSVREVALRVNDDGWQGPALAFAQDTRVVFVLKNTGQKKHLFVIGDAPGQRDQALMHRLMPADTYDYPNTRHLAPGNTARVGWRFNRRGTFSIRCLLPGHQANERGVMIRVSGDH